MLLLTCLLSITTYARESKWYTRVSQENVAKLFSREYHQKNIFISKKLMQTIKAQLPDTFESSKSNFLINVTNEISYLSSFNNKTMDIDKPKLANRNDVVTNNCVNLNHVNNKFYYVQGLATFQ